MPRCLIDDEDGVCFWRDGLGNLGKMLVFMAWRFAPGQDEGHPLAQFRTDCSEDPGRTCTLIGDGPWTGATPGPSPRQLRFLAAPRLVTPPELNGLAGMPGGVPSEGGSRGPG